MQVAGLVLARSSFSTNCRARRVRPGLLERSSTLLLRGSAITTTFWLGSAPCASSSGATIAATSTAMPCCNFTTSVSMPAGVSTLAITRAMRSRLSA